MRKILLILIFIISACKGDSENEFTHKLSVTNSVSLKIDNNTSYNTNQTHVIERNDTTILLRKNAFNNSIAYFNWDTQKKLFDLKFKNDGPNKVLKFNSAAFKEIRDSLIIIGTGYSDIYLMKKDSIIFKKNYSLNKKSFGNMINGFNKNLPVEIDNNIYFFRKPPVARTDPSYYDFNLLVNFNLNNKSLTDCSVKYPKTYKKGECWSFEHLRQSFVLNENQDIIFSFPIDPNLYKYNIGDDNLIKITNNTSSTLIDTNDIVPLPDCGNQLEPNSYYFFVKNTPRYESIVFDKHKEVYYRFVLLPSKELNKNNSITSDMRISIMVLDSNFNLIGESLLPEKTYDYSDYFVTKEGLWLSKNNPNNSNFDENLLSYDLFSLSKNL